MNPLRLLDDLVSKGMQPVRREVWLGLGFRPPKRCAITIDPLRLPGKDDCRSVAGLDVIVCYHGHATRYGELRSLCGALYSGRPRLLLAIDMDIKRVAYLKLGPL